MSENEWDIFDNAYAEDMVNWGLSINEDEEDEEDEEWDDEEMEVDAPDFYEDHGLKQMVSGLPNQLVLAVGLICDEVSLVDMNAFLIVTNCFGNLNFMKDNALYQLVDDDGSVRDEVRQSVEYWHRLRAKKESASG